MNKAFLCIALMSFSAPAFGTDKDKIDEVSSKLVTIKKEVADEATDTYQKDIQPVLQEVGSTVVEEKKKVVEEATDTYQKDIQPVLQKVSSTVVKEEKKVVQEAKNLVKSFKKKFW